MTTAVRYANVNYWGRNRRLPVRPSDEEVRYTFSTGQCHSLALALHTLTGWPLFVLCDPCYDGDDCPEAPEHVACRQPDGDGAHVVVKDPSGRFVDIAGSWWPDEPLNWSWDGLVPVPVTEDEVLDLGWDQIDAMAALPFAEAVLRGLKVRVPRLPNEAVAS